MATLIKQLSLYFSYSQFLVYDKSIGVAGFAWTDRHSSQGFARQESGVAFNALAESGKANLSIFEGHYEFSESYRRVIAVPFLVSSGTVLFNSPDELKPDRDIVLAKGYYRLVAAQALLDEELEDIDLYFEPRSTPIRESSIIVQDSFLAPIFPLLETVDKARP